MDNQDVATRSNKILFKEKILKAGINLQQKLIEDSRNRVNEIMDSKSNESDEHDNHHQSFKAETIAEVSLLSDQLQFANQELEQLRHIQNYSHEKHPMAEYGTVVK